MKTLTKSDLKKEGYSFAYKWGKLEVWDNLFERLYYDPKAMCIAFRVAREFKLCVRRLI